MDDVERTIEAITAYPIAMPAAQGVELGGEWNWRGTIITLGDHRVLWRCSCVIHRTEMDARRCSEAEFATGADAQELRRELLYDILRR